MKFLVALVALLALAPASFATPPEPCAPPPAPCLPPPPSCEGCVPCEGAITELTLAYRGESTALVIIYQGDVAVFCDEVPPCEPFDIYEGHWPGPLGADLVVHVNDQYVTTIPMRCDPSVYVGAEFGPFVIYAGASEAGPLCSPDCFPPPPPPPGPCDCKGKVTTLTLEYRGPAPADVRVEQKKNGQTVFEGPVAPGASFTINGQDDKGTLGTEIRLYVDGLLHTAIHTSCSQPIGPGLVAGDFLVLEGASREGGPLCPLDTPPGTPPGNPDGCDCEGKVRSLGLRWNGDATAFIQVQQKDGQLVFAGDVAPGELFSFFGMDKNGTLGTEISLSVDGASDVAIHTSCSKPIGPGLVVGRFEVAFGESLKGGELCPTDADAQGDGSSKKGKKDKKPKGEKKDKKDDEKHEKKSKKK